MGSQLWRRYLSADPRSLAAGRIALALVLLLDLAKRAADLDSFYTNAGLLPNHTLLWRPTLQWVFSFFYMASWRHEAILGFVVCAIAYTALLVGYRTRLAHVASFICVLSLHGRVLFVQNGGDVVLGELCLWTMFLPTGRRYSIDSLRARLRDRQERDATELQDRDAAPADTRPVVSLAFFAVLMQLALIYFFNAVHKTGPTWADGSVVHYVLHQDRIVTTLGVWAREHMAVWQSQAMTWSALAIEAALPFLILSPVRTRAARWLAILFVISLHVGFGLFLNLGVFVPTMIAFTPNLISAEDWNALERWWARRPGKRTVVFDGGCGICFAIVRALARIDRAGRLTFVASEQDAPESLIARDPATGRSWTGAAAFGEVFRMLPFGWPLGMLLQAPVLNWCAEKVYSAFAKRRTRVSMARRPAPAVAAPVRRSPLALGKLREALVLFVIVAAATQVLVENRVLHRFVQFRQPRWAERTVVYLQLFQGWSMFAPDAPTTDMNIYVDALTVDGRRVDPFNLVANPSHPAPGASIPARLDQNSFFCDYLTRIPYQSAYHQAFIEWILDHPRRTRRPEDRIVSFEAFVVEDDSPPPGETQPRNPRVRSFLKYDPRQ
jgi:predicted DCC family thiol-disulfide oxidoreductase YuxK